MKSLTEELGLQDEHRAHGILRAVLHTLRDRLPIEQVAHLGAQLPTLIRGIYYEGWNPSGKSIRLRHKIDFLDEVWFQMSKPEDLEVEIVTKITLRFLSDKISEGEMRNIAHVLPEDIRELLPESVSVI
jgi:uncharacterized protein (DUF2267 family)